MRAICLLILLIPLVNSAPTAVESAPTDCNVEIFRAKMCWQLMPASGEWDTVPKEEFAAKKSNFLTCLGEPKCELTQNWLKMKNAMMSGSEGTCEMYGCLGNGTFREIEYKCKKAGRFIIYTDKNYTNCFIENIRKAPKCTSADLETFDQVVKSNEDFFKAQELYIENLKQFGTNIQGCILDAAYETYEHKCQYEEKNKERREPEFMNCLIKRVKNAGKCSPSNLKQFEKILKELDEFKKQIGHKEQYE